MGAVVRSCACLLWRGPLTRDRTVKIQPLSTLLLASLLGACASTPPPPPAFDPSADVAGQAASFIQPVNADKRGNSRRAALTACNVVFGIKTSASASTQAGMFESNQGRVDAKISEVYLLQGVSDAQLQGITDRVCAQAEQQLARSGLDVMSHRELAATAEYQALTAKGRPGPVEWSVNKSDYKVFAPSGWTVFDQRFDGTGRGIANIFKQATRNNPDALEGKLVNALGVTGVHVDILIDFASLKSGDEDNKGFLARMAGNDEAKLESSVELSVTGMLKLVTPETVNCHKLGCDTYHTMWPAYKSSRPLLAGSNFYTDVVDAESTAGKVAEGFATALGWLTAMAGGSGSKYNLSKWAVQADPARYASLAEQYSQHFVTMAAKSATP